jgi:hypothetical protein
METVSIRLQGGLGNYLFQIACAYSYALKHNKEMVLTKNDAIVCHEILDCYNSNILNKINFSSKPNNDFKIFTEPESFEYKEIPFIKGDVYLKNYFQSEKYFQDYKKEIKELFSFPNEIVNNIKSKYENLLSKKPCFIHVRRGNYLQAQNYHPVQDLSYYMKAIKEMGKTSTFAIFSDDIKWCKENFPDSNNFVFIEGQKDYEDLLLMSLCENGITANSTFSWWGAWFIANESKKIISPKNWFGTSFSQLSTKDLYCENWIKI